MQYGSNMKSQDDDEELADGGGMGSQREGCSNQGQWEPVWWKFDSFFLFFNAIVVILLLIIYAPTIVESSTSYDLSLPVNVLALGGCWLCLIGLPIGFVSLGIWRYFRWKSKVVFSIVHYLSGGLVTLLAFVQLLINWESLPRAIVWIFFVFAFVQLFIFYTQLGATPARPLSSRS